MATDPFSGIFGLIFLLVICYFCFKYSGRNKQQQQNQQQQQQIVVQTGLGDKKVRVCPKCGMQNDVTNKFCSDCAYEFKKTND